MVKICNYPKPTILCWSFCLCAVLVVYGDDITASGRGNAERSFSNSKAMSTCELLSRLESFRGTMVSVRGIYWQGLRQVCSEALIRGGRQWPSAINLVDTQYGGNGCPLSFKTDSESWDHLDQIVLREARMRRREEIWVTVRGLVQAPKTFTRPNGLAVGGYGHLGMFPAQLIVERISGIEIKPNPTYDYSELLHAVPQ